MNILTFFRSIDKNHATLTCMIFALLVLVLWSIGTLRDYTFLANGDVADSTNAAKQSGWRTASPSSYNSESQAGTSSKASEKTAAMELEITQTRNKYFRESLDTFAIKFDRTRKLLNEFVGHLDELASSDSGRKVASSDDLVRGFISYQEWGQELGKRFKEMILERSIFDQEVAFHNDSNSN